MTGPERLRKSRRFGIRGGLVADAAQPTNLKQDAIESLPLDELHRVIVYAVLLPGAEDGNDVGVMKLRRHAYLTAEALQVGGVHPGMGGQDLERDVTAQRLLHGLVNDTHAAAADL